MRKKKKNVTRKLGWTTAENKKMPCGIFFVFCFFLFFYISKNFVLRTSIFEKNFAAFAASRGTRRDTARWRWPPQLRGQSPRGVVSRIHARNNAWRVTRPPCIGRSLNSSCFLTVRRARTKCKNACFRIQRGYFKFNINCSLFIIYCSLCSAGSVERRNKIWGLDKTHVLY